LRRVHTLGDDERDRIADMAHLALRQKRPAGIEIIGAVAILQWCHALDGAELGGSDIGAGIDREHAWRALGRIDRDRFDARMGMRRAQEYGVSLARIGFIIGVAPLAGDEAHILRAANRLADPELTHALPLLVETIEPSPPACGGRGCERSDRVRWVAPKDTSPSHCFAMGPSLSPLRAERETAKPGPGP